VRSLAGRGVHRAEHEELRAELRRQVIGYLPQEPWPVEFLSALENVTIALSLRGFSAEAAAERRTSLAVANEASPAGKARWCCESTTHASARQAIVSCGWPEREAGSVSALRQPAPSHFPSGNESRP
jgi:hypothetical protein